MGSQARRHRHIHRDTDTDTDKDTHTHTHTHTHRSAGAFRGARRPGKTDPRPVAARVRGRSGPAGAGHRRVPAGGRTGPCRRRRACTCTRATCRPGPSRSVWREGGGTGGGWGERGSIVRVRAPLLATRSLSLTHTHTHTLSLSLTFSHTHTHTQVRVDLQRPPPNETRGRQQSTARTRAQTHCSLAVAPARGLRVCEPARACRAGRQQSDR